MSRSKLVSKLVSKTDVYMSDVEAFFRACEMACIDCVDEGDGYIYLEDEGVSVGAVKVREG